MRVTKPFKPVAPLTVRLLNVPTLVSEEAVTPLASVVPVSVPAAAVTVMSAVPLKLTPLMFRAVWSAVAVAAFPVVLPLEPVTDPLIGFVTVRLASVPTEVSELLTTLDASVVPVSNPAGAAPLMLPVKLAVIVLALKLPEASRRTTVLAVLSDRSTMRGVENST